LVPKGLLSENVRHCAAIHAINLHPPESVSLDQFDVDRMMPWR